MARATGRETKLQSEQKAEELTMRARAYLKKKPRTRGRSSVLSEAQSLVSHAPLSKHDHWCTLRTRGNKVHQ